MPRDAGERVRALMVLEPREYLRPWKLATLAIGLALLVGGSFYYDAPDWDVPICFIMAPLAYLCAPFTVRVLAAREWRLLPAALAAYWFTVDGSYCLYWGWKDPGVVSVMREANLYASSVLYAAVGLLWHFPGPLREVWRDLARPSVERK